MYLFSVGSVSLLELVLGGLESLEEVPAACLFLPQLGPQKPDLLLHLRPPSEGAVWTL